MKYQCSQRSTVNTRNVCQLLNAVAPCSVTEFKKAALEYICLNLEDMLENQYAPLKVKAELC